MIAPDDDELELSLFGPGFGESLVMHVGSGNWLLVDSCIDASNNVPAALYYFHQMGIDPAVAVKRVVVTHWHDDHVRGIGKVLRACRGAKVCIPMALHQRDFVKAVVSIDETFVGSATSGVSEIRQVFESEQMKTGPILAGENTVIWSEKGASLAHAADVELRALSPSGLQGVAVLHSFAQLAGKALLGGRTPRSGSNDLSIAAWLSCGKQTVLLGADLEVHSNPACGWTAVLALANQLPGGKASVIKIPHHGSKTGHDEKVWETLVAPKPIALLTPWTHGSGLPELGDVERIKRLADQVIITNPGRLPKIAKRDPAVEKTLRDYGISIKPAEGVMGHIRLRKKPDSSWRIERFGAAEAV